MKRIKTNGATGILVTGLFAGTSCLGNIISSYTDNGNGTITYTYQVDNVGGSFDIASWSLEFNFATPDWDPADTFSGGQVHVPNSNWFSDRGIPTQGQSAQDFLALGPAGDIPVGQSLEEFSFTSTYLPGLITYFEFSANGDFFSGTTFGPVNRVPEGQGPYEVLALLALAGFAIKSQAWRKVGSAVRR